MANPLGALGSIPIMQVIQNTLQNQADINRTNATTSILNQQSQLLSQKVQSEERFNQALAQMASAKQAKETSEAGQTSQSFAAFGNTEMGKPIMDGYKAESESAQQNRYLAQVAQKSLNYEKQKFYEDQARASDARAAQWYLQGLKLASDQRKQLASAAGAYSEDGSNLQDVVDSVNSIDPHATQGSQFNRDGSGNIVPGPKTTAAFSSLADRSMSRSEQLTARRDAERIKNEAARNEMNDRREAERERMDDSRMAALQHGIDVSNRRLALAEKAQAGTTDQDQLTSDGAMVATGMPLAQAVPGWGASAVNKRESAKKEAIRQIKEEMGVDDKQAGKELAQRQIDYFAGRRSTTQLNTMLGATRQAVSQLEFNVNQTKKILQDIPSTDLSPLINSIIRGEERWTGDPRYSSLYFYMHAVAMESARILQGGQASIAQLHQGAAEEAKKWADIGLTPKMFDSVAKSIIQEGEARISTYVNAMKEQRVGGATSATPTTPPPESGNVVNWSELK